MSDDELCSAWAIIRRILEYLLWLLKLCVIIFIKRLWLFVIAISSYHEMVEMFVWHIIFLFYLIRKYRFCFYYLFGIITFILISYWYCFNILSHFNICTDIFNLFIGVGVPICLYNVCNVYIICIFLPSECIR